MLQQPRDFLEVPLKRSTFWEFPARLAYTR